MKEMVEGKSTSSSTDEKVDVCHSLDSSEDESGSETKVEGNDRTMEGPSKEDSRWSRLLRMFPVTITIAAFGLLLSITNSWLLYSQGRKDSRIESNQILFAAQDLLDGNGAELAGDEAEDYRRVQLAFRKLEEAYLLDAQNPRYFAVLAAYNHVNDRPDFARRNCLKAVSLDPAFSHRCSEMARKMAQDGYLPEALSLFREIHLRDHQAGLSFAGFLVQHQMHEEAKEVYLETMASAPSQNLFGSYYRYLESHWGPGAVEESFAALVSQGVHPNLSMVFLAKAQEDLANFSDAEASLRAAVNRYPNDSRVHVELGAFLARRAKDKEAKRAFQKSLQIEPHNREAHLGIAGLFDRLLEFEDAEYHYRRARRPRSNSAEIRLVEILLLQGKVVEAEEVHLELVRRDLSQNFSNYARFLDRVGQSRKAELFLTNALKEIDRPDYAYAILGEIYRRQGRLTEAEGAFQKAVELDPDPVSPFFEEGLVRLQEKIYNDGRLEEFLRTRSQQSDDMRAALWLESQGELDRALGIFEHIAQNEKDCEALIGAWRIRNALGNLNQTSKLATAALELSPQEPHCLSSAATFLLSLNEAAQAELLLERVIELDPLRIHDRFDLGALLEEQGRLDEALTVYQQIVNISPRSRDAYRHLEKLLRALQRDQDAMEIEARARAVDRLLEPRARS